MPEIHSKNSSRLLHWKLSGQYTNTMFPVAKSFPLVKIVDSFRLLAKAMDHSAAFRVGQSTSSLLPVEHLAVVISPNMRDFGVYFLDSSTVKQNNCPQDPDEVVGPVMLMFFNQDAKLDG